MKLINIDQGVCWNESISIQNKSRLRKNLWFIDAPLSSERVDLDEIIEMAEPNIDICDKHSPFHHEITLPTNILTCLLSKRGDVVAHARSYCVTNVCWQCLRGFLHLGYGRIHRIWPQLLPVPDDMTTPSNVLTTVNEEYETLWQYLDSMRWSMLFCFSVILRVFMWEWLGLERLNWVPVDKWSW